MCQQATCARLMLLLILGFLMLYDNQATSVEKRSQAAGDVKTKLILKAVRNLKIKIDTLVESVDKSRRKSKEETENLEEKVQRLENKTEQFNERLERKTEQINERLEKKTNRLFNTILYTEFYVSGEYKGKIYLLSKVKQKFDLDRNEGRCESLDARCEVDVVESPMLFDQITENGGWLLLQRRNSGLVAFHNRSWEEYKTGFGTFDTEFWLGLDAIHKITSDASYEIRFDFEYGGKSKYAVYDYFLVESEVENFQLTRGNFNRGPAGDAFSYGAGIEFSTLDRDNDKWGGGSCAQDFQGAWWFWSCSDSNPNGVWGQNGYRHYRSVTGDKAATYSEIKIRRVGGE